MTFGERDPEMASVSVPIFRRKKEILGSLTIAGHISNFNKKNCIYFLNTLRSSKIKIEKNMKNLVIRIKEIIYLKEFQELEKLVLYWLWHLNII